MSGAAGTSYPAPAESLNEWTSVTIDIGAAECRLVVNGTMRHVWQDDFTVLRSRIGIGPLRSSITVRELRVELAGGG